jgi:hypothetical protein
MPASPLKPTLALSSRATRSARHPGPLVLALMALSTNAHCRVERLDLADHLCLCRGVLEARKAHCEDRLLLWLLLLGC